MATRYPAEFRQRAVELARLRGKPVKPLATDLGISDQTLHNWLKQADIDTLILGCTHYPLVAPMLQRMLGRDVRLITAGHAVAAAAQRVLETNDLTSPNGGEGTYRFLCTGDVTAFREMGTGFLQMPLGEVEHVEVPDSS